MTLIERYRADTQRLVLASNSWPCGHLWAGPTPPNPTHLFSRGTNTWPGGQLPCAAAGVETKFATTNKGEQGDRIHLPPSGALEQTAEHCMHEATLGRSVPISDWQKDSSGPVHAFYAVLRSLTRLAASATHLYLHNSLRSQGSQHVSPSRACHRGQHCSRRYYFGRGARTYSRHSRRRQR